MIDPPPDAVVGGDDSKCEVYELEVSGVHVRSFSLNHGHMTTANMHPTAKPKQNALNADMVDVKMS